MCSREYCTYPSDLINPAQPNFITERECTENYLGARVVVFEVITCKSSHYYIFYRYNEVRDFSFGFYEVRVPVTCSTCKAYSTRQGRR